MLGSRVGSITLAILFSLVIPTSNLSAHVEPRAGSQTGETVAEELVTFRIRIQNIALRVKRRLSLHRGLGYCTVNPTLSSRTVKRIEARGWKYWPRMATRQCWPLRCARKAFKLESSKDLSVLILPGRCGLSNFTSLKLPPHLKRPTLPLPLCSYNPTTCSWHR